MRVLSFQNVKETANGGSLGRVTAKTASGAGSTLAVLALLSQTYITPPFSQPKAAGSPATNRVVLGLACHFKKVVLVRRVLGSKAAHHWCNVKVHCLKVP